MRSIVLSIVLIAMGALPALGESTEDSLAAARARLEQLRRQTDATTQRYAAAEERVGGLDDGITEAEAAVKRLDAKAGSLRKAVAQRAVEAYVGSNPDAAGDGSELLDAARAEVLLSDANSADDNSVDALGALLDDIDEIKAGLVRDRVAQRDVVAELAAEQRTLEAQLTETAQLESQLEIRLTAEQEAARQAAAEALAARERQQQLNAQQAAASRPAPSDNSGGSDNSGDGGTSDPPPTSGGGSGVLGVQRCPISGPLSFIDSWHAPRSGGRLHMGVDLMTSSGSANVAVTSGTASRDYGSMQGNSVFLYGDNGNTYYYFHLSSYGASGRVSAGTVVGYSGNTGNASGGPVHTHFEIHPGGGSAVNPTPAVSAAC